MNPVPSVVMNEGSPMVTVRKPLNQPTTTPTTLSNITAGKTDFTIYQDPYLQGFLPTLYTYLYNISGGTIAPPNTDTGLTFITKSNAAPYSKSSRFQGSTAAQKYIARPSGAIQNPVATTST